MKKSLFFFAAAALALTACSNDDATQQAQATAAPQAVAFDTYSAGATRAGLEKGMTTDQLKLSKAEKGGFGVFAQYSEGDASEGTYSPATGSNFMWNQGVFWEATSWAYSPLKYWPNETTQDTQSATMSHMDKLSFFAYAPFVEKANNNGELTGVTYTSGTPDAAEYGIVKVTASNATTDPMVMYRVSHNPANTVDLLWGVAPTGNLSYLSVNPAVGANSDGIISVTQGLPLIDLIKPSKEQKMKFLFQHALSRIDISVVGAFDQLTPGGTKGNDTKVLVKEVKIYEGTEGSIKTEGWLNLNNRSAYTALWSGTAVYPATALIGGNYTLTPFYTIANSEINSLIKYNTGDGTYAAQPAGVTSVEQNLFEDDTKFFAVIPSDGTQFKVEITYYVITNDPNLSATQSSIENIVTKTISVDLKSGKSYNLRLILGLTSVKLDAEVGEWLVGGNADANLPRNN